MKWLDHSLARLGGDRAAGDGTSRQAIRQQEEDLAGWERLLGPDDRSVLNARAELARVYLAVGRPDDAITLLEQNLAVCREARGVAHADTRRSLASLVRALGKTDRQDDLAALVARYASETEAGLGPDHPDAAVFRAAAGAAVAVTEMAAGQVEEAVATAEQSQHTATQASGPDSDAALIARAVLAEVYRRAGQLTDAIGAGELNLAECIRVRGENSRLTLLARNNLGAAYRDAGRLPEAVPLFERNLIDAPAILPSGHYLLERILRKVPPAYGADPAGEPPDPYTPEEPG